jgi:hypothetical protein
VSSTNGYFEWIVSVRWAPLDRRLRRQSAPYCGHRKQRRVKHVKIRRGCAFACRRGYRVIGDGTPARPGYEVVQIPSLSPIGGVVGVYLMLRGLGDYCGHGFLARAAS